MLRAVLAAAVAATACSVSLTGGGPSPTPVPPSHAPATPAVDYNNRWGNNRAAAHAALVAARFLARDGSTWEAYLKATPEAGPPFNPLDPGAYASAGAGVTGAQLTLATESASSIQSFRTGGHDHEAAVIADLSRLLLTLLPAAASIRTDVYYGESHQHSTGVFAGGKLDYRVMDNL